MDNIGDENEGVDLVTPSPRATPPEIFRPTTRINPSRMPSLLDALGKMGRKVRQTRREKADRKTGQRRRSQERAEELRLNVIAEPEVFEVPAQTQARDQDQTQAQTQALALAQAQADEATVVPKSIDTRTGRSQARATRPLRGLATFGRSQRAKIRDTPTQQRTRWGINRSHKLRNTLVVTVSAVALAFMLIVAMSAFQYVRPTQGIKTAAGSAMSVVAVTDKLTTVAVGDTVVVQLGVQPGGKETVLMGTVRSMNADTIFVSDNNTTWAVKPSQVKGHVWFTLPAAAAS